MDILKGKKILLLDDSPELRLLAGKILQGQGVLVTEASNVQEALLQTLTNTFDLIISDLMMPVEDGFVFMEKYKLQSHSKSTPILILSGKDDQQTSEKALFLGASAVFIKPLRLAQFIQKVKEMLQ